MNFKIEIQKELEHRNTKLILKLAFKRYFQQKKCEIGIGK